LGKHREYSVDIKMKAVKSHLEDGKGATQIAKDLGVASNKQVKQWVSMYLKYGDDAFIDKRGRNSTGRPKKDFNSLEEENEYLRAKVDLLETIMNLTVKKK